MFHHFYDVKHCKGQGAISAEQLNAILDCYGRDILPAEEWLNKAVNNTLRSDDVCLTFDDTLLCQYEVALPVLEKRRLTAFWFIYSSVLDGGMEMLEIYRKFRTVCFPGIADFYKDFFQRVKDSAYDQDVGISLRNYSHDNWQHCPFYSPSDTKFRYVRDVALGVERYGQVMNMMLSDHGIDPAVFSSDLWMTREHVKALNAKGHMIGMHSHTHPMVMAGLSAVEQEREYQTNYNFIYELLGKKPEAISYPCNSYNKWTLKILSALDIKVGFRANMEDGNYSKLEFPREDHANIIQRIKG